MIKKHMYRLAQFACVQVYGLVIECYKIMRHTHLQLFEVYVIIFKYEKKTAKLNLLRYNPKP